MQWFALCSLLRRDASDSDLLWRYLPANDFFEPKAVPAADLLIDADEVECWPDADGGLCFRSCNWGAHIRSSGELWWQVASIEQGWVAKVKPWGARRHKANLSNIEFRDFRTGKWLGEAQIDLSVAVAAASVTEQVAILAVDRRLFVHNCSRLEVFEVDLQESCSVVKLCGFELSGGIFKQLAVQGNHCAWISHDRSKASLHLIDQAGIWPEPVAVVNVRQDWSLSRAVITPDRLITLERENWLASWGKFSVDVRSLAPDAPLLFSIPFDLPSPWEPLLIGCGWRLSEQLLPATDCWLRPQPGAWTFSPQRCSAHTNSEPSGSSTEVLCCA